jgi:hypothetical protein
LHVFKSRFDLRRGSRAKAEDMLLMSISD